MNIDGLLKLIDSFEPGNIKQQLENLKSLSKYLKDNKISSIDEPLADEIVKNHPKISYALDYLLNTNDISLLQNEVILSLFLPCYKDIETNLYFNQDTEFDFDKNVLVFDEISPRYTEINNHYAIWKLIHSIPSIRLTREEEKKLLIMNRKGNQDARDYLVLANIGLVVNVAYKYYAKYRYMFDDIFQEGIEGLLYSMDHFDIASGNSFSTYAIPCIRCFIQNYINKNCTQYSTNNEIMELLFKIDKKYKQLTSTLGRYPTDEELREQFEISVEKLKLLFRLKDELQSIDAPIKGDEHFTIKDTINSYENVENIAIDRALVYHIMKILDNSENITQREKEIIKQRYRYGEEDVDIKTFEEVGKQFNISRQRIDQIEKKVFKEVRNKINR